MRHRCLTLAVLHCCCTLSSSTTLTSFLKSALSPGVAPDLSEKQKQQHHSFPVLNMSELPAGCNPRTGRRCRDRVTGLLPPEVVTFMNGEGTAMPLAHNNATAKPGQQQHQSTHKQISRGQQHSDPRKGKGNVPPPPPVPDTACGAALDPTMPPPANASASAHGWWDERTDQKGQARGYHVFHGGGNALGNMLLGYLTSFHDALRSSRRLLLHKSGMGLLPFAFELGVPFASERTMRLKPACQVRRKTGCSLDFFIYC